MDLDGHVLGTFAENLRLPGALAIHGNELVVAELSGRATLLGRDGQVLATIGENDNANEISTNKAPPEIWREGSFYAPHGITYDAAGNLRVCEFNQWGRVSRLIRN
jgi:peptidylamidoglycolate lyase